MALTRINRAAMGSVPPSVPFGFVIPGYDYYTGTVVFINLIRNTLSQWSGTGAAAIDPVTNWITALSPGQRLSKNILIQLYFPFAYIKPGNYVVTWSGPLTVDPLSSGAIMTNKVVGANRVTFTLADVGEGSGAVGAANSGGSFVYINVDNNTGTPASVSDIAIFHADYEALHLSGEIFDPTYIESQVGGSVLRYYSFTGEGDSTNIIVNFSQFATEANCMWYPAPPSVIAKLAVKTNTSIWLNFPHQGTQSCFNSAVQAIWNVVGPYPGISLYCEPSNETWNSTTYSWISNFMRDTKSVGLTIVDANGNPSSAAGDKIACATAHTAMQAWAAADLYFPRGRIKRVFCGQDANWATHAAGFEYADAANVLYPGQKLKAIVDHYGVAPYMRTTEGGGARGVPTDMSQKLQISRSDAAQTDAYWDRVFSNVLDVVEARCASNKTNAVAKRADISMISYECGHEIQVFSGYTQSWQASVVTNELDFGLNITGIFANGDTLCWSYQTDNGQHGGALFSGGGPWLSYKVRIGTTNNKLKVYANQATYDSDTPATLNTLATTGGLGDGFWRIDPFGRLDALGIRMKQFLDSERGALIYAQYRQMFMKYGFKLMDFVGQTGGYQGNRNPIAITNTWNFWGLRRSQYDPLSSYQRAAWLRRFANGT